MDGQENNTSDNLKRSNYNNEKLNTFDCVYYGAMIIIGLLILYYTINMNESYVNRYETDNLNFKMGYGLENNNYS